MNELLNIIEKINDGKFDNKKKSALKKLLDKEANKIFVVIPYTDTFGLEYVNIEASGVNDLPMFEIKNMN